jgi:ATP-dependent helicase/nuclease subunit B
MPLTASDALQIVEAGLAELTLGLVPPTVDQVLVGSIERSRHPDIQAAIVLGFNDGIFPSTPPEDTILNDEQRTFLEDVGVRVGTTRRQRVLDERMLAYVALTRASGELLITCAASDESGRALRPSPYIADLREALPALAEKHIDDPVRSGATFAIRTVDDLAASLTLEMGRRVAGEKVATDRRQRFNDLYHVSRSAQRTRDAVRKAMGALVFINRAGIGPETVNALITGPYTASVSELESFAACPFQRFSRWGLKLKPRRVAELQPMDIGTVHHAILEAYLNECLESGERFAEIADADVLSRLERCAERVGMGLGRAGEVSSARDAYILARSAQDLSRVVRGQRALAARGRFGPKAAEREYGFAQEGSLPALEVTTPMGRRVFLRGVIDRVDLAEVGDELLGVVIDYKRTRDKRLNLANVYHGLSLQLLGYLLALAEQGETPGGRPIVPVGAFYVSLLRKYRAVAHPDEAGDVDDDSGESPPRGLFDATRTELLESDAPETGWTKTYKVYRKKDGSLGHVDKIDAATSGQFKALLAHTRKRLGELADGVLDGNIEVAPYRLNDFSPCQWCDMRPVCRFEFADGDLRHLPSMKRSQVLVQIEEKQ